MVKHLTSADFDAAIEASRPVLLGQLVRPVPHDRAGHRGTERGL